MWQVLTGLTRVNHSGAHQIDMDARCQQPCFITSPSLRQLIMELGSQASTSRVLLLLLPPEQSHLLTIAEALGDLDIEKRVTVGRPHGTCFQ